MFARVVVLWWTVAMVCIPGCSHVIVTAKDVDIRAKGVAAPVSSGVVCDALDANRFHVTLPRVRAAAAKQVAHSQWCWAACAQITLAATGTAMSQEQIAAPFVGADLSEGASPIILMCALNPDLEQRYRDVLYDHGYPDMQEFGRRTAMGKTGTDFTSDDLILSLSSGDPVILGMQSTNDGPRHLCVISGATYSEAAEPRRAQFGLVIKTQQSRTPRYALHSVDIIDPDPDVQMFGALSGEELKQGLELLMTRKRARTALLKMIEEGPDRKTTTYTRTYQLEGSVHSRRAR